jgi:hypothetical protein
MMAGHLEEVHRIEKFLDGFEVRYVPRLDNHDADHLAWIASSRAPIPTDVIVEKLSKCIVRKARMYHLIDGALYRQGTNGMMMRCISREEGIQLLQDTHIGACGSDSSWRSIIGKAFRHGFYSPTTKMT